MCVMSKMLEQLRELILEHLDLIWVVNLIRMKIKIYKEIVERYKKRNGKLK
jgi:hypothetical protein